MGELAPRKAQPMAMADDNFFPDFPTPFPLLERFFTGPLQSLFGDFGLSHNPDRIYERDGKWVIEVPMPGVHEDDVKVETDGRILTVTVDSSEGEAGEGRGHFARNYFRRAWSLPRDVEGDPELTLDRGVLVVAWDRRDREKANSKTRTIPVRSVREKD